ncbi:MAG TPA: GNAT family N-acetyltransferase [Blastocatellia bacterium]|nr:GNAT family N-acetyltransferase [Blastocatellia bacterium]
MATVALKNPELRIIPLEEADLPALERLFDEQCEEWLRLLKWDYSGPSRLIREVARHRELSGYVALMGDLTVGFSFYVIEGNRCSIGDIYVSREWRGQGADRLMAGAILDRLDRLPRLRRVESQCVSVGNFSASELFEARSFNRYERFYMLSEARAFDDASVRAGGEDDPDILVRPWRDDDFGDAARIIQRSYRGEPDSLINSQYRTESGCAELLSILTDHIWCGDFLPDVTRVAVDRARGASVGVLIASRIGSRSGHISQISLLPSYQNRGIGRRMIRAALGEFKGRGFSTASLAVTSANLSALRLYQSCGFRTVHSFPVFYR